ncbi:hypothetical protein [Sorangium sp. So ce1078]
MTGTSTTWAAVTGAIMVTCGDAPGARAPPFNGGGLGWVIEVE